MKNPKYLTLVELNEINFDLVSLYLKESSVQLPALEKLMQGSRIVTSAEPEYDNLEPWIQWPSVHTGLSFNEHGIFRLGDIVGSSVPQIFEQIEDMGYKVGCISAMNAENNLRSPAYFVPDPWTETSTDGSWWSRSLSSAVSQAVNDNANSRIGVKSLIYLALCFVRFARLRNLATYFNLIVTSRKAPWRKALVLDLFLHDIHSRLSKASRPNFSTIFLNAGAHIQHHYYFNSSVLEKDKALKNPAWYVDSEVDPVLEMLVIYDRIIQCYQDDIATEVVIATGLSQRPYDRIKYYYRLVDHADFLKRIDVNFDSVSPRMTRDFLVSFSSVEEAENAENILKSIVVSGSDIKLFGLIDNRGESLFVTLTYSDEIMPEHTILVKGKSLGLLQLVAFVAIKNGMHQSKGFAFFTAGISSFAPKDGANIKELYNTIFNYFGEDSTQNSLEPIDNKQS